MNAQAAKYGLTRERARTSDGDRLGGGCGGHAVGPPPRSRPTLIGWIATCGGVDSSPSPLSFINVLVCPCVSSVAIFFLIVGGPVAQSCQWSSNLFYTVCFMLYVFYQVAIIGFQMVKSHCLIHLLCIITRIITRMSDLQLGSNGKGDTDNPIGLKSWCVCD